ncbi:uncharacterized protein LOC127477571 [Manacus candei]|uniref:uncharacterized protein LOC127477571 n=1 Tax=Manacus candei TaxID=415023 RepID=UPI00222725C7|nr:uncharacterized protein LOC127477571 [Manacus candei]
MPKKQEGNAHHQPHERLPPLRDGAGGRGWSGKRQTATPGTQHFRVEEPAPGWSRCSHAQTQAQLSCHGQDLSWCQGQASQLGGFTVPTQLPPSHATFCFPEVRHRQPPAAPRHTGVTSLSLHGKRLPPLPRPAMSQSHQSLCTQDRLEGWESLPHRRMPQPEKVSPPVLLVHTSLQGLQGTLAAPRWLTLQTPKAASANVTLSPLPAAASGSSLRGRARAEGLVPRGHQELVPPAQKGTTAADRAWETPSPGSRTAGLWERSMARPGHCLPPLGPARGSPLCTWAEDAQKDLPLTKIEELEDLEEEDDEKIYGDLFRDIISYLEEESSIETTCIPNQSSLRQEPVTGPQVLPSTPSLTSDSTGETENYSEQQSPAPLADQQPVSEDWLYWDTVLKELLEECEEEEVPDREAAGEADSELQSTSLAPFKEQEAETAASPLAGVTWDEEHSEPEESSGFSASLSPGGFCEESQRETPSSSLQPACGTVLCTGTEDAGKHPVLIKTEEVGELEEEDDDKTYEDLFREILSSLGEVSSTETTCIPRDLSSLRQEPVTSPQVLPSTPSLTSDSTGETENYSEQESPAPLADQKPVSEDWLYWDTVLKELQEESEEEEVPDREAAGEGTSDPQSALLLPLQDKACPVPAQPLANWVPSPTGPSALPHSPAPQPRRSIVRMASRALRWVFSFHCLRGQGEE